VWRPAAQTTSSVTTGGPWTLSPRCSQDCWGGGKLSYHIISPWTLGVIILHWQGWGWGYTLRSYVLCTTVYTDTRTRRMKHDTRHDGMRMREWVYRDYGSGTGQTEPHHSPQIRSPRRRITTCATSACGASGKQATFLVPRSADGRGSGSG